MTENKKKRFFNAFDIIVVLMLAAVLIILFKVGVFGNATASGDADTIKEVTYVFRLRPMRFGTENNISIGDELIETVRKTSIGTVLDIRIEDNTVLVLDQTTGEYVEHVIEGEKTVFLTVKASCIITDNTITTVDVQSIRAPEFINVNGPGYYGNGTVISIERGDGV